MWQLETLRRELFKLGFREVKIASVVYRKGDVLFRSGDNFEVMLRENNFFIIAFPDGHISVEEQMPDVDPIEIIVKRINDWRMG